MNKMKFTKWEYKISFPGTFEDSIHHMDNLGQEGWESCGIRFTENGDIAKIVWKRPIE